MTTQAFIALLADGLIVPVVLIAAYALLFKVPPERRYESYSRIIVVGLTSVLIAKLLGFAFQPAAMRPFELLGVEAGASFMDNPGFPSDHALFTAFLTLAVWFETRQRNLTLVLGILTLLIGTGRVLALVHTPLDIIGGFTVAAVGALWFIQTEKIGITKPTSRKKHKQLVQ